MTIYITHKLKEVTISKSMYRRRFFPRATWDVTLWNDDGKRVTVHWGAPAVENNLDVAAWKREHMSSPAENRTWKSLEKIVGRTEATYKAVDSESKGVLFGFPLSKGDREKVWSNPLSLDYEWQVALVYPIPHYIGPNHIMAAAGAFKEVADLKDHDSPAAWWDTQISEFGTDFFQDRNPFRLYDALETQHDGLLRVLGHSLFGQLKAIDDENALIDAFEGICQIVYPHESIK